MDRSRHSITKYTNHKKTPAAIHKKLFKRLGHINDQLHKVELTKSEIEQKELIYLSFFILQNAKLRSSLTNYFTTFCDTDKYEEMKMDTDSLYSALAEKQFYACIRSEKRQ